MNTELVNRRAAVVRVQLIRETGVTYQTSPTLLGPQHLADAARALIGDLDREAFLVLFLDQRHRRVASMEIVTTGTLSRCLVHPREVFKGALLANASAVAFAHLHPSGDPTPSAEDLALTRQLMLAGEILGIRCVDHVVLGDPGFTSIRETTSLWLDFPFHQ